MQCEARELDRHSSGLANGHTLHYYYRLWHCQSCELKWYDISFSPQSKVHILFDSLMCHCWNILWMKWHALFSRDGHYFAPCLASFAQTEQRLIFCLCVARPQTLAARILPKWLISFPATYYHTKASFTVWALWLAADLKAAILNMNGADSLMFVFLRCW